MLWSRELSDNAIRNDNGRQCGFSACCKKGAVHLEPWSPLPQFLRDLLLNQDRRSRQFRANIRRYNNAHAFTSVKAKEGIRGGGAWGPQTYHIQGALVHVHGPLQPEPGSAPVFAQLYFYDPAEAVARRSALDLAEGLDPTVLAAITNHLHEFNPHARTYLFARERVQALAAQGQPFRAILDRSMQLVVREGADMRRENLPTAREVAAIFDPNVTEPYRELMLAYRDPQTHQLRQWARVHSKHPSYLSLQYPLMLPLGDPGFDTGVVNHRESGDCLTLLQFANYRLYVRPGQMYVPFAYGALFQQFVVDLWASLEQERIGFITSPSGQKKIRSYLYAGLEDILRRGDDVRGAGRRIILPSTHKGSPRAMSMAYQNSMAIVRYLTRPTLFITFTSNPNWPEILAELLPGQSTTDRPDLVARVFNLKLKALISDLKSNGVFGRCTGIVYTVEYQKRGLPHAHILLFLHVDDRRRYLDPANIDRVICAELPTPEMDPTGTLRSLISKSMIHGPCGIDEPNAACMDGAKCTKRYPRPFQDTTVVNNDGYPTYRRRPAATPIRKPHRGRQITIDNDRVVPYNPYLSKKFDAHINVEICATISAIKYLHKYVHKGPDIATVRIEARERSMNEHGVEHEGDMYLACRYIGPMEACWRLFGYSSDMQYPAVLPLAVHLPGQHNIVVDEDAGPDAGRGPDESLEDRLARLNRTTLTAYFELNQRSEVARRLRYSDIPGSFVWQKTSKEWTPRKKDYQIGRMHFAHPATGERFFLRLLLTTVRGATSYEDLRTVDGRLYATNQLACEALGLHENDGYWARALQEASLSATGHQLRGMFVIGVTTETINDIGKLWQDFRESLCDDLPRVVADRTDYPRDLPDPHLDYGLYLLRERILSHGEHYGTAIIALPVPVHDWAVDLPSRVIQEATAFDAAFEGGELDSLLPTLNADQRTAFDTIVAGVADESNRLFFVHGWGGTGKTYLYKVLCHHYRSQGKIVLCVASSGIAALLLPGGRTAHSRFKIPVDLEPDSLCNIPRGTELAGLLQRVSLIIWDEVPMQNRMCVEAVSRTLQDVRVGPDGAPSPLPFGGVACLFGGDFAQIPPVVPKGSRGQVVSSSLRSSWPEFRVLFLKHNMRVHGADPVNRSFISWLQKLPYDRELYGTTPLPPYVGTADDIDDLCTTIFPPDMLAAAVHDSEVLRSRVILASHNASVADINAAIAERMPGAVRQYLSINTLDTDDDNLNEDPNDDHRPTVEVLQSIETPRLPPAVLSVKVGMPVMLIRNLDPKEGLCNGTRLAVTHLHQNCIRARILGGQFHLREHYIPRIKLYTDEKDVGFRFMRAQIPVRPCFAITINKSQGQSFDTVGVDLRTSVFAHGQFYVAMSRITNVQNLYVLTEEDAGRNVQNVVWPELLLRDNRP
jgi:hypothetical protein